MLLSSAHSLRARSTTSRPKTITRWMTSLAAERARKKRANCSQRRVWWRWRTSKMLPGARKRGCRRRPPPQTATAAAATSEARTIAERDDAGARSPSLARQRRELVAARARAAGGWRRKTCIIICGSGEVRERSNFAPSAARMPARAARARTANGGDERRYSSARICTSNLRDRRRALNLIFFARMQSKYLR